MMTREEKNEKQRAYRLRTGNIYTKQYEKTIKGFVMRMYRNMKSRVSGVQKQKAHLYHGKDLLDKDSFYQLALGSPVFYELFGKYRDSNFDRKLAPTPDRIDSSIGYVSDNIQFVTHSVNSSRGALNK